MTRLLAASTCKLTTALLRGRMRPLMLVIALFAIPLTGCGSDAAAAAPSLARAVADAGRAQTGDADPRPVCPNPHGGQCLGPLEPGTYTTVTFSPAITYTVPAGWTNGEDLPGNFLLQLEGDSRYLGIYRDANVPDGCAEHPDPDVSQSVSDYTRWLRRHPLLRATKPIPVSLGGLHGVAIDISKAPGTEGEGCTYEETITGAVPFIVGGRGPASLHHVIMDGWKERLYLLRYKRGNVAIEVGPEGASLPEYLKEIRPILRSLRFAKD